MKLVFSLFMLLSLNSFSKDTPFVLITYEGSDKESMQQIEKVMNERFKVSKDIYKIEYGPCQKQEVIATHICLDRNKEVKLVYRNEEVMEEMLGVYWK
ncbi:hypothetical protein [Halobacteriovorax sp. JY17]|uniref:hypothetical protein n=1 Tax=Halobacteriovorax sp. JY17 TaxID=2014617 RepID=UPI000C45E372|nr:hypothetical protein [Halobacteriovorax sp. JY17]PIK16678.1 MAG: hypothetical protein CES88_08010 [Halobacteriovorax sp. JY17]